MEELNRFWKNVTQKAKGLVPLQVFPAVVKQVDEKLRTCTVRVNDNVDIEDVRLYAVVDDGLKGFCLLPATDSTVLVGRIANSNELFVCSFSVVDKVLGTLGDNVEIAIDEESLSYKCDKTEIAVKSAELTARIDGVELEVKDNKVKVKADEIAYNGGKNDGLIKINDLTTQINGIVDKFNNHTHPVTPKDITTTATVAMGPVGQISGTVPAPSTKLAKLDKSDYEDTKIKH